MVSEDAEQARGPDLPEELSRWLDEKAGDLGVSREELLSELLAAYRAVDEDGGMELASESDVDALREEFMEKLTDVRERVIQVKREADEKADPDHDHADLREELTTASGELTTLEERVVANRERMDAGFDNYEEVLEYLTETTEDVEERVDVLASALLSVRDRTAALAARDERRAAVAELARTANRNGVKSALCGECEVSVAIALLRAPECPHCGAPFRDVEPKRGFFGSNTLVVGDPPALEGETLDEVDDLLEEVSEG